MTIQLMSNFQKQKTRAQNLYFCGKSIKQKPLPLLYGCRWSARSLKQTTLVVRDKQDLQFSIRRTTTYFNFISWNIRRSRWSRRSLVFDIPKCSAPVLSPFYVRPGQKKATMLTKSSPKPMLHIWLLFVKSELHKL